MTEAKVVEDELAKHPAAASPQEVLDLKPNKANPEGPSEQISPNDYVTWTKPDGSSFLAPASNSEVYERKGYKQGATQDIPDFVAHLEEMASKEPAKAAEHPTRGEHAEAPKAKS